MNFRSAVHAELPFLRRYSRTLMGNQALGDALVRETLEALIEAPDEFHAGLPVRQELYRWFSRIWRSSALRPIEMPVGILIAADPAAGTRSIVYFVAGLAVATGVFRIAFALRARR